MKSPATKSTRTQKATWTAISSCIMCGRICGFPPFRAPAGFTPETRRADAKPNKIVQPRAMATPNPGTHEGSSHEEYENTEGHLDGDQQLHHVWPHMRPHMMQLLIAVQVAFCVLVLFVAGPFMGAWIRRSHGPWLHDFIWLGVGSARFRGEAGRCPERRKPAYAATHDATADRRPGGLLCSRTLRGWTLHGNFRPAFPSTHRILRGAPSHVGDGDIAATAGAPMEPGCRSPQNCAGSGGGGPL